MTSKCPEGHASTEPDYCSVCGAAMPTPGALAARDPIASGPGAVVSGGPACPKCGEPRAKSSDGADARYCEVCRFDFVSHSPGPPPGPPPAPPPAPAAAKAAAPLPVAAPVKPLILPPTHRWEIVLTIDPSLDDEPDPAAPPPKDPERFFPVEIAELLVGRRDDRQNIRPAVPLNDPGASRRHAKFLLNADGTVSLQDLASMNGTKLNATEVVSGSVTVMKDGDEVTLGRWSRMKLRQRP